MMMSWLVSGALRVSLVLALALVACAFSAKASAATRRALLVTALAASLLVPVVAVFGPSWRVAAPAALGVLAHESLLEGKAPRGSSGSAGSPAQLTMRASSAGDEQTAPSVVALHVDASTALGALWILGVIALLGRAVASQLRARRLVRESSPLDPGRWSAEVRRTIRDANPSAAVDVRLSAALGSPAVTGVARATILLPLDAPSWATERTRVVLMHELAHVARRDGAAQLVADLACALHWCNPLVWVAAWRLRIERELAADDAVLAGGVRASSYAEQLLALAGAQVAGTHAMAERTALQDRIVAILAAGRVRSPLAARGSAVLFGTGAIVSALAACASPQAAPSPAVASAAPPVDVAPPATTADATDPVAQAAADEVLASVVKDWSAQAAVVLVLDAASGEILADSGRVGEHPFDFARARAITPGSTLKPITIAAALESGAITADQMFDCGPAPRSYGGAKQIRDSAPHGTLDVAHLLAVSSNIGTSRIFDALGGERTRSWFARFHLNEAPPLAGAATGVVPATLTSGTFEGASAALGEGTTATPLQMAAAYAAIASDGVYHAPTTSRAPSPGERLVSAATAHQVMAMLATAVTDPSATGKRAQVDGVPVAGKTGTADFTGPDGREHTYASFIGIADLPRGGSAVRRIVAVVGVESLRDDVYGGEAAAPAFARLITRLR